jgi:hypothetical protein
VRQQGDSPDSDPAYLSGMLIPARSVGAGFEKVPAGEDQSSVGTLLDFTASVKSNSRFAQRTDIRAARLGDGLIRDLIGIRKRRHMSAEGSRQTKFSRLLKTRLTCESCRSIDVRRWNREGLLQEGRHFPCSWTYAGKPCGSISVRTEEDAVVLVFSSRRSPDSEWKPVEQRVSITWTACHFSGRRAWFRCPVYSNGRYCGRRVALFYGAGDLFACRHCYGLAYASQRQTPAYRGVSRAQKTRMRLGGSPDLLQPFPKRPRGMHRRTYMQLRTRDPFAR